MTLLVTSLDSRVGRWLGVVCDLIQQPLVEMPYAVVAQELSLTFDVTTVTWQWRDDEDHWGFEAFPMPDNLSDAWWCAQRDPLAMKEQPLLRWFSHTGDPRPQSNHRVPATIATQRGREICDEVLKPIGCEQQLSIPYELDGVRHRAFLLSRADVDFDDQDMAVAGRLQSAFAALDRQAQLLAELRPHEPGSGDAALDVLTAREVAVLSLLVKGSTASSIAHRLLISPRTVHKHIEHIYRKLGVRDRLAAARAADEMNLFPRARLGCRRCAAGNT